MNAYCFADARNAGPMQHGFRLRKARADDIPLIAEVMHDSMSAGVGKGVFDDALIDTGTSPLQFHEALLTAESNNWGQLSSFLVVVDHRGDALGALGAFRGDMDDLRPLTASGLSTVSALLDWSSDTTRGFWLRYVSFFGLFGKAPQLRHAADYVLEYGAIKERGRGKGLYQMLFEGHARRARDLGHDAMSCSGVFGNNAVMRSLNRFGFKEFCRLEPAIYRNQYPGMIRFRYEIEHRINGAEHPVSEILNGC